MSGWLDGDFVEVVFGFPGHRVHHTAGATTAPALPLGDTALTHAAASADTASTVLNDMFSVYSVNLSED